MNQLTLQVFYKKDRVYAQHRATKNTGHLAAVYPGGSFMGYSFDELVSMGSGVHEVELRDPYDAQNMGQEPAYESPWRAELARFEFVLFGYRVGAYTTLDVLAVAREVDKAEFKAS